MHEKFDSVLRASLPLLRNYARKLTRDETSAEDLTQETLFKLLENKERYDVKGNFQGWATTIMRNLFINDLRRKSRATTQAVDPLQLVILENYLDTAENEAEMTLQLRNLHRFVNELEDGVKNPFVLYLHGFSYEEISDLLQMEINTLRGKVFQARRLLQERITRAESVA